MKNKTVSIFKGIKYGESHGWFSQIFLVNRNNRILRLIFFFLSLTGFKAFILHLLSKLSIGRLSKKKKN